MKLFLYIIALFILACNISDASAQFQSGQYVTIFDVLQQPASGKGEVLIDQPNAIRNMVGARHSGMNVVTSDGSSFLKVQGYRVQIFSGNDQRTSKDEAFKKEKEVNNVFPNLKTYVTFVAPFWRLRVGDYASHEEAYYAQRRLSEAFPSYGKEMYIIKEEVKVPLEFYY
ncbi:hypothetical protein M2459_002483 [Parabacteroides sp. PF5-5]|uniref:SPOR domain-containing protein n=1 Tax=unclassified Parabacteroides TaxID=2649774 RepID=UPI002475F8C6|nr:MULTISPECIES: SPOR domain-containing protein [unclassified Parabacteroides]MDH6305761.1 hypothetical protein [Parabacteroides sp. PH5-39]MDH6316833.1 hypothetical protein [Parabacteroides sp. PF5-13]MDH6320474.1 hypothetical protein [Parabacteroides sp. PH5-13]MDH6324204.1 hypothetical protein [Parabacteroides sp. PH5-8]MDH6328019.1 hypothetical protein [Parabacteroides sp. PH5-41]